MEKVNKTQWSNEMLNKKKEKWEDGIFTGPKAPWGYQIEKFPKRHLIVDERLNDMVKMIFQSVLYGCSVNDIIKQLNEARLSTPDEYANTGYLRINKGVKKKEWTYKMLLRILQNRIYTGCLEHGKKVWMDTEDGKKQVAQEKVQVVENTHEAYVTKEEFEQIQINLAKGSSGSSTDRMLANYEGYLYCGVCGKKLRRKKRGKYVYYGCLDSVKNGEVIKGCEGIKIEKRVLEKELDRLGWSVGKGKLRMIRGKIGVQVAV